MRTWLFRGVVASLVAAGVGWSVHHIAQLRAARQTLAQAEAARPIIMSLPHIALPDSGPLFDNIIDEKKVDTTAAEVDLFDLNRLCDLATPTRPSYEDESAALDVHLGPDASDLRLIDDKPIRYMPYADDKSTAEEPPAFTYGGNFGRTLLYRTEEPPLADAKLKCDRIEIEPAGPEKLLSPRQSDASGRARMFEEARRGKIKRHTSLKPANIDEAPAHPEIDTMEYRPTDCPKGAEDVFRMKKPY